MQRCFNLELHHVLTAVLCFFSFFWRDRPPPQWAMASSFTRFLDHTQRHITVGRTPLDEWSARHRDLYLTTHNTHDRQTSMPPVGFEPTISAGERPLGPALLFTITVGSRFATVSFTTIHFYDPCRVGPSTADLRCITVATQASFLYLVLFQVVSGVHVFLLFLF